MFRVKICGVTCSDDAAAVVASGADAIGLNFYTRSVRQVSVETAREICRDLPDRVARVGVFVNADPVWIRQIALDLDLNFIQLHGDESARDASPLAGLPLIRAVRAQRTDTENIVELVRSFEVARVGLSALLVDAYHPQAYGGTGHVADWELFRELKRRLAPLPLILAGGLRPQNVADAVVQARPDAVDTASGVERGPGRKDPILVREFVSRAIEAFEHSVRSPGTAQKAAKPERNGG